MTKALKKDRNERFASAQDMARDLSAAVPGLGLRPSGAPQPLPRLPEPPGALGNPGGGARLPPEPGSLPTTMPAAGAPPSPVSATVPAPILVQIATPTPVPPRDGSGASGDTLASLGGPGVTEAPPNVEIANPLPFAGTLQSRDGRRLLAPRRSVGVGLVVVLVAVALAAGFLLGWAAATATR
jgi:hypothetical protein